ncbi:hypothetical protein GGR57DRAFT_505256 [Xylariaceae sp. FL1272]|nr:hypothetical protein GGR57DRAFT_505256 [Xylariaceae sp. FL1272]
MQELEDALKDGLDAIQSYGSFASSGKLDDLEPGLFVRDGGDISLPLTPPQVRQLIEKSRQAPYGKGSETIVDTSVRNTWELDASVIEFRHPGWNGFVQDIYQKVAARLGVSVPVPGELYKLLIYEKGAMFKAHTDTEKVPGMFGTLVISLPSPHEGGDLVVKHCGSKKRYQTSSLDQSFICWYADVIHEDTSQERPTAALLDSEHQGLRAALASWLDPKPAARLVDHTYYTLDHSYTQANISFGALKDRDFEVVRCLKDLSRSLPFEIFLAVLEKEEEGHCAYESDYGYHYGSEEDEEEWEKEREKDTGGFHPLDEVLETSYKIKSLVELSGHEILRNSPLDEGRMLDPDSLETADPEEEYEGYMGNWGPQATHWYRVTAVLVVARDSLPSFFEDIAEKPSDSRAFNEQSVISYPADAWKPPQGVSYTYVPRQPTKYTPKLHSKLLQTSISHKRWDFLSDLVGRVDGSFSPDFFAFLKPRIENSDPDVLSKLLPGCTTAILSFKSYYQIFDAVQALGPLRPFSSTDESIDSVQQWLQDVTIQGIQKTRTRSLGHDDGAVFAAIIEYLGPDRLVSEFEPYLSQQLLHSPAFAFSFLSRLNADVEERKIDRRSGPPQKQRAKAARYGFTGTTEPSAPEPAMTITAECLLDLVSTLKSFERDDLVTSFLKRIQDNVFQIPTPEYHGLWLPFLRGADPMSSDQATWSATLDEQPWMALFIDL